MPFELEYGVLIAGSAFVAVMSLVTLVLMMTGLGKSSADERIDERMKSLRSNDPSHAASPQTRRRSRSAVPANLNKDESGALTERIVQAGLYKRGSMAMFSTVRFTLMILPVAAGIIVGQLGFVPLGVGFLYGIISGVVGTVLPSFWLDFRKSQRQSQIRRALPDALDVIVTCVDAGMSLPSAIQRVSRELRTAHPMLAVEMSICQREIQLGASTGAALRKFSQRFDLEELRSLASVIQQAEKYGASITNALRVHADVLREKRFQRAEEQAQKAAVKIVFPTILCIFPALFVVVAGPAVYRIFQMFEAM